MDDFMFLAKGPLAEYLGELEQQADQLANQIPEGELVALPPEADLCTLFPQLAIEVPALLLDRVTPKREILPSGASVIRFYVPFRGAPCLFSYTPKQRTKMPPRGTVSDDLVVTVPMGASNSEAINTAFRETVDAIEQWLEFVRQDIVAFRTDLSRQLAARISRRRDRVIREQAVAEEVLRLYRRETSPPADACNPLQKP